MAADRLSVVWDAVPGRHWSVGVESRSIEGAVRRPGLEIVITVYTLWSGDSRSRALRRPIVRFRPRSLSLDRHYDGTTV